MTYPIETFRDSGPDEPFGNPNGDAVSAGQIAGAVARHWIALVITVVAIVASGFAIVRSLTPTYTSTAILVLSAKEDSVVDMQQPYMHAAASDALIRSETDALLSRSLVDRVIDQERLMDDPEFNIFIRPPAPGVLERMGVAGFVPGPLRPYLLGRKPDASRLSPEQVRYNIATQLLRNYSVTTDPKTYSVDIAFTSTDPAKASRIANRFVAEYLASQVDERIAATDKASSYLNPKLAELSKQVEESARAVEEYRQAHSSVDLPGSETSSNTLVLQEIQNLAQGLNTARTQRAQLEAAQQEIAALRSDPSHALSAPAVTAAPVVENLRVQEATAAAQLASLLGAYGERHPLVISARNGLEELRTRLTNEAGRALDQFDVQLRQAKANEEQIQGRMNQLTRARTGETNALPRLRQLESEQAAAKSVYDAFVQGQFRAASQDGVPLPKGRVVQQAHTVDAPTFPNVRIAMAVISSAAVMIGFAVVYALEAADMSFRTAEQLERGLKLQVLGLTLRVPRSAASSRGRVSASIVANPMSAMSETVRLTRTALTHSRGDRNPKVVMVTSAAPGEGKTTFALMMARQTALAGRRVIAVEAELRRPTFAQELDAMPVKGLGDFLAGRATLDEIIGVDTASGVHFIAAGSRNGVAGEPLALPIMGTLLHELSERYDFIVIDTPPASIVADALQMGTAIDAAVLVVKWNATPRYLVRDAVKKLRAAQVPLTGAVMTQVDARRYRFFGQGPLPYQYAKAYYTRA